MAPSGISYSPLVPPPPAYIAFRAASAIVNKLPPRALTVTERVGAWIAPRVMPARRDQVVRNVRRIKGPLLTEVAVQRMVQETFGSYLRYWIESFRLPDTPAAVLDAGVQVDGFEHIEHGLEAGNGVIIALPHLGGWEWAAYWLTAVKGLSVSAVVEPLAPPELADWFVALREEFGLHLIPLGPGAGTACAKVLRDNHVLALLSDRDLAGSGIDVEFFGERTTLPGGPATLALRGGATLLTAATYFDGRQSHRFVVDPPMDTTRTGGLRGEVARVTQQLAHRLEVLVRAAPEQWHLLQPNWPSDVADQ